MYHLVPENFTQGKSLLEEAVRVYNNERIHMNIDLMVPSKARELHNRPPKRWRNYHSNANPIQVKH